MNEDNPTVGQTVTEIETEAECETAVPEPIPSEEPEKALTLQNSDDDTSVDPQNTPAEVKTEEKPIEDGNANARTTVEDTTEDTASLRAEVDRLRAELHEVRENAERLAAGYEELTDLFPSADLGSMPDSFRDSVRRGVPPAAAYALEMRRREVEAARAAEAQRIARESSVGGVSRRADSPLSPDEVRAMSREEVRENFSRILESMKCW